jgi:hypothetical protein
MMQRPSAAPLRAANDNVAGVFRFRTRTRTVRPDSRRSVAAASFAGVPRRPRPLRPPWLRPGLLFALSGLLLVALSGALLVELAAVGLLAAGVTGVELARRHMRRPGSSPLDALGRQMAGYRGRP